MLHTVNTSPRDFHDRICYGTDIASRFVYNTEGKPFNEKENLRRPEIVRDFLFEKEELLIRADGNFIHNRPDFMMRPLGLSEERLDEILSQNFMSFAGGKPASVSDSKVLRECERIREKLASAGRMAAFKPDYRGIDGAEAYFSSVMQG